MNKKKDKKAKWELIYDGIGYSNFSCSSCNGVQCVDCKYDIKEYKFCPRCGTKMEKWI